MIKIIYIFIGASIKLIMIQFILFVGGVAIGNFFSWFFTRRFYIRSSEEQSKEHLDMVESLRNHNKPEDCQRLLEESTWTKKLIGNKQIWFLIATIHTRY